MRWKRTALRKVKHLGPFAHGLLEEIELRMLPRKPRTVVIAFAIWWMVSFFAAPHCFETEVFVPRIRMKLSNSKSSIAEPRHRSAQVGPTTRFHLHGLTRHSICLRITENTGRRRLASGADCVARGNAHRAGRVCARKTDSPSHQPIHVRRVDVRVPERSDRIKPLLVGHDEQNVRPSRRHRRSENVRRTEFGAALVYKASRKCHSERSAAKSRNPAEILLGFATGCLDFARHDERKPEMLHSAQHDGAFLGFF